MPTSFCIHLHFGQQFFTSSTSHSMFFLPFSDQQFYDIIIWSATSMKWVEVKMKVGDEEWSDQHLGMGMLAACET